MDYDPFDLTEKEPPDKSQESNDLAAMMATTFGRRFICGMLGDMGVWRSSFSSDPLQMAFAEGRRSLGLVLTAKLMAECPKEYFLMLKEFSKHD